MDLSHVKKILREIGLFMADIVYNAFVIIVLVVLIRTFLISPFRVVGSSMADTLQNKEFILIDKISYYLGDIDRGDPIVFLPPVTSKDVPKFEERVIIDELGRGTFDFSGLIDTKETSYCRGSLLKSLWFCKERVREEDLIYFAPQKEVDDSHAMQTDWNAVQKLKISDEDIRRGFLVIDGAPESIVTVRAYHSMGKEYFVKRIIGIPGDTVKIDNGRVYLRKPGEEDFSQIGESFLNEENLNRTYISQKQRQNVYEVPEGYYFVMGDNRNHSNDSRSWLEPITQDAFPFVPEANISGRVMVVLWPLTDFRLIHRADF